MGCDGTFRYKPSDDALTRKIFENYLTQANIGYRVNDDGFYEASADNYASMHDLGRRAISETNETSGVVAESDCAVKGLKDYLTEQRVVFVEVVSAKRLIWMKKVDADRHKVMERYASFAIVCGEGKRVDSSRR